MTSPVENTGESGRGRDCHVSSKVRLMNQFTVEKQTGTLFWDRSLGVVVVASKLLSFIAPPIENDALCKGSQDGSITIELSLQ